MSTKMTEQQRKRTNIDQVFKDDAVKHLIQSEKPTEQIARELGTSAGNFRDGNSSILKSSIKPLDPKKPV
jgi:transposase-like protein